MVLVRSDVVVMDASWMVLVRSDVVVVDASTD